MCEKSSECLQKKIESDIQQATSDTIKYYVGQAVGLNFDKISYTDETKEYFKAADLKKGLKNCRTKDDVVKLLNFVVLSVL